MKAAKCKVKMEICALTVRLKGDKQDGLNCVVGNTCIGNAFTDSYVKARNLRKEF